MPRFKKGSAAAKAYMAKIRAKKTATIKKPVITKKITGISDHTKAPADVKNLVQKIGSLSTYKKAPADVKKLVDSLEFIDNYKDIQKVKKAIEKKGYSIELSMDGSIESLKKLPAKKVGYKSDRTSILRKSTPYIKNYLDKGYTRKEAIKNATIDASFMSGNKKPTSMHKDTKSHNVNIKVVSGLKQLSGVAPHKAKYFIEFMYQGIERTEYFDKLPADRYKGINGIIYVTRLTDYGTTLCPLLQTKNNLPLKK